MGLWAERDSDPHDTIILLHPSTAQTLFGVFIPWSITRHIPSWNYTWSFGLHSRCTNQQYFHRQIPLSKSVYGESAQEVARFFFLLLLVPVFLRKHNSCFETFELICGFVVFQDKIGAWNTVCFKRHLKQKTCTLSIYELSDFETCFTMQKE